MTEPSNSTGHKVNRGEEEEEEEEERLPGSVDRGASLDWSRSCPNYRNKGATLKYAALMTTYFGIL